MADNEPIPMRLPCEGCGELHIDEGEFATKQHHTHSCQRCGLTWRPCVLNTVGVRFLPGFKNKSRAEEMAESLDATNEQLGKILETVKELRGIARG